MPRHETEETTAYEGPSDKDRWLFFFIVYGLVWFLTTIGTDSYRTQPPQQPQNFTQTAISTELTAFAAACEGATIVVNPGTTLGQIATTFGTTPEAIGISNNIADINLIQAGQTLCVEIPSATDQGSQMASASNP